MVQAKTGTVFSGDMSGIFLNAKAMAGYMTAKSGRESVFAVCVNDLRITGIPDAIAVGDDLGRIAELFDEAYSVHFSFFFPHGNGQVFSPRPGTVERLLYSAPGPCCTSQGGAGKKSGCGPPSLI